MGLFFVVLIVFCIGYGTGYFVRMERENYLVMEDKAERKLFVEKNNKRRRREFTDKINIEEINKIYKGEF